MCAPNSITAPTRCRFFHCSLLLIWNLHFSLRARTDPGTPPRAGHRHPPTRQPPDRSIDAEHATNTVGGRFGILSSDASSLQVAPPASCSSRCGRGLRVRCARYERSQTNMLSGAWRVARRARPSFSSILLVYYTHAAARDSVAACACAHRQLACAHRQLASAPARSSDRGSSCESRAILSAAA